MSEKKKASWSQSVPNNAKCAAGAGVGGGGIALTVTSSGTFAGNDFANFHSGAVSGTKFEDQNGDGIITSDGTVTAEPRAWSTGVCADTNTANGVLDAAEFTAGPAASTT